MPSSRKAATRSAPPTGAATAGARGCDGGGSGPALRIDVRGRRRLGPGCEGGVRLDRARSDEDGPGAAAVEARPADRGRAREREDGDAARGDADDARPPAVRAL